MSAPFIVKRLLPEFCYSDRLLPDPYGAIIHWVSARWTAPKRWADIDTIWNQTVELNRPGSKRGPLLERDEAPRSYASYQIVTDRGGNHYQWVPFDRQSYHAGQSEYWGRSNLMAHTFGWAWIGKPGIDYTDAQYEAGAELARFWCRQYGWDGSRFAGHNEVATPAGRKKDPGRRFDWPRFRAALEG